LAHPTTQQHERISTTIKIRAKHLDEQANQQIQHHQNQKVTSKTPKRSIINNLENSKAPKNTTTFANHRQTCTLKNSNESELFVGNLQKFAVVV